MDGGKGWIHYGRKCRLKGGGGKFLMNRNGVWREVAGREGGGGRFVHEKKARTRDAKQEGKRDRSRGSRGVLHIKKKIGKEIAKGKKYSMSKGGSSTTQAA